MPQCGWCGRRISEGSLYCSVECEDAEKRGDNRSYHKRLERNDIELICETCPEFNGRDKYCRCGLYISSNDKRICYDHPSYEYSKNPYILNVRKGKEDRKKRAIRLHGEDYFRGGSK